MINLKKKEEKYKPIYEKCVKIFNSRLNSKDLTYQIQIIVFFKNINFRITFSRFFSYERRGCFRIYIGLIIQHANKTVSFYANQPSL